MRQPCMVEAGGKMYTRRQPRGGAGCGSRAEDEEMAGVEPAVPPGCQIKQSSTLFHQHSMCTGGGGYWQTALTGAARHTLAK